ncbi:MAG: outer rane lipoproteinsorting protein [Rhodocyclales bacterium]|nr:outer rane lipoproteinsorting protein [Rhodocyclales bacterium]
MLKRLIATCLQGLVVISVASLTPTFAAADDDVAKKLVETADRVRFPAEGFQVDINITSRAPDQPGEARKYRVLSKGNDNTIVMTVEPAADRGQMLLMKARDLWLFMPAVSQPIRLSVAQRMTGEVSYGDLARANFSGDYTPKLLRTDKIDGEDYQVVELTAVDRGVAYSRVLYWIRSSTGYPHRAEFYSLSNRLLKTCRYENFKQLAGHVRPTRLVMEDALKQGEVSVLEYEAMKLRDLPDYVFTKEYLKKLE